MNSYEYMQEVKRVKGLDTDYKLCKELGWKQNKVTQYKNGTTMDNEAARQIAEILDLPLLKVIADMEMERQKDPSKKKAWKMLSKLSKETGKISPNLLFLQGIFSFVGVAFYILCKIAHEQNNTHLGSKYKLA